MTEEDTPVEGNRSQEGKPIDERLQKVLDKLFYGGGSDVAQAIRNFLNGTWLGEPLHASLTDVPIGAWTIALAFDALEIIQDRREFGIAADTSIGIGLLGSAGAAVAGLVDWSDVDPPARRVGMNHALLNMGSTALFATSLVFRRRKKRAQGRIFAGLGFAMMLTAAKLGGEMVYRHQVGVDRTSGQPFPEAFVAVMEESELKEDTPTRAEHDGVPILLVRRGTRLFALAETCSHFGAPLSEGKLVGDSIVCPWHESRFALADGSVINGPAVHPQPCLEARIQSGKIEVRRSACNRD